MQHALARIAQRNERSAGDACASVHGIGSNSQPCEPLGHTLSRDSLIDDGSVLLFTMRFIVVVVVVRVEREGSVSDVRIAGRS